MKKLDTDGMAGLVRYALRNGVDLVSEALFL
jgi:hypothetical protein